jgi:hypothetical protein
VSHVTKLGADRSARHCEEVRCHCALESGEYRTGYSSKTLG